LRDSSLCEAQLWQDGARRHIDSEELVLDDLRYALRTLNADRPFFVVSAATLGLGIALVTAAFTVVNALFLRPLPYEATDELFVVQGRNPRGQREVTSLLDFLDLRAQTGAFSDLAAFEWDRSVILSGGPTNVAPRYTRVTPMTVNGLRLLGAEPSFGRGFQEGEGGSRVALLGYALWQRTFAADEGIIGSSIDLNGIPYAVIGVMPRDFDFYQMAELWIPLPMSLTESTDVTRDLWGSREDVLLRRDHRALEVIGRLSPDSSPAGASSELQTIANRLQSAHPDTNEGYGFALVPLEEALRPGAGFAWVFLAVMALITAIACANILNLQLARALTRRREVTVRRALGASRAQVVRQLLVESCVVSAAACVVGLVGAQRITDLVLLRFANLDLPHWVVFEIDWRILLFTVGAGCAATMLFGLIPALGLSRGNLREMLDGRMGLSGRAAFSRRRAAIVVAQFTVSVVIVCAASLVARSAFEVTRADNGLDEGTGLWLRAQLSALHVADEAAAVRAFTELTERIERFPEVSAAGASHLNDRAEVVATMRAGSIREDDSPLPFIVLPVSPGYLPALGARLLRGRHFIGSDETAGEPVIIVEESTAQRLFGEGDPIGQQVLIDLPRLGSAWHTIIGVVADFRYLTIGSATGTGFHRVSERAYIPPRPPPVTMQGTRQVNVLIRTDGAASNGAGPAASLLARIRAEALAVDPNLAVEHIGTLARFTGSDVGALLRQLANALALCAAIISGLAALGIYGVLSHSAAQRTPEIGIRMALGARPFDAVALVVASGVRLTLLGLGIGLAVAFGVNRVLWLLLYEVSPMDAMTLVGTSLGLTVVGLLASYLPARRAARVDPMLALRRW